MKTKSRIKFLLSLAQAVPGAPPSPDAPASPTPPASPESPASVTAPKVPAIQVTPFTGSEPLFINIKSCWDSKNISIIVSIANILNKILASIPGNNVLLNNLYPPSQTKLGPSFQSGGGMQEIMELCKVGFVGILDLKKAPTEADNLRQQKEKISKFRELLNKLPTSISQRESLIQTSIKIENSLKSS
jgi:hypothetical protein